MRYIYCVSQELGVQDENGKFVIDTLRNVMNIYPIFGKDVDHMIDECLYNRLDGITNVYRTINCLTSRYFDKQQKKKK